jgi:hypothetical protein
MVLLVLARNAVHQNHVVLQEEKMSERELPTKVCPLCNSNPAWGFYSPSRVCCTNGECQLSRVTVTVAQWNTRPLEDKLRADLARRDDLIKRLVEDGERLADKEMVVDGQLSVCKHNFNCGGYNKYNKAAKEIYTHAPDCPITLHRALMKEIGGEK